MRSKALFRPTPVLKRDGICNPVTPVLKAIEAFKRFGRGCKTKTGIGKKYLEIQFFIDDAWDGAISGAALRVQRCLVRVQTYSGIFNTEFI
ncbi:MAG: hypothetical protein QX196_03690 [Methylococcaceae bacterium]